MTTMPSTTRTMPVARFRVLASALLAKTAAMRAHSRVNRTQRMNTVQSGAPPTLSALNWQKVPLSVGEALGEQKKKLFGNALLTVKEMIANGELYIADIHIDGVYEHEYDSIPDEDDCRTEYDYYIQFSTPDLAPCDTDCEVSEGDYDRAEALLKSGGHDAKILWGRKKKANYYYAFVPRNSDAAAMLTKGLFEKFIGFGECTEKRKLPY